MRLLFPYYIVLSLLATRVVSLANLTLHLPPTDLSPNPSTLPPSTRATLVQRSAKYSALLTRRNTFDFTDISPGSYLLNVQCRDLAFAPLRVDVVGGGDGDELGDRISVWQTFLGNAWGNKGEMRGESREGRLSIEVRPVAVKNYYMERAGFSPLDFLKSPMILLALVSLVLIVGMPYLIDGMDDETKEEFEQMQSKSPLTQASNPTSLANFDFAAWMAGKPSENSSSSSSTNSAGGGSGTADFRRR
ncbi:MAG: hypothetical protein M1828_006635 [Chrysothrix sp. TS-e1954]|nr:MAG: hypothetical protein M1828_006635 [Chrysothrix sp. TS-e1954]